MVQRILPALGLITLVLCLMGCMSQPLATPVPYPGPDRAVYPPSTGLTAVPKMPPTKWGPPPKPGGDAVTTQYAVQVVDGVIEANRLTILYAVALAPSVVSSGSSFSVTLPTTTQILANQQPFGKMLRSVSLRSANDVNVGVAVFGFGSPGGGIVSLQIPAINVTEPNTAPITLSEGVEIQLIEDIAPKLLVATTYQELGGIMERQVGSVKLTRAPGFYGPSPKGEVVTVGVNIGTGGGAYALVNNRAEITSLNESDFKHIESYLGLPTPVIPASQPTRAIGTPIPVKPGVATPPPLPGPGNVATITPPPPLVPKSR